MLHQKVTLRTVLNSLKLQKLEFPIIVKPNIGLKGLGVVEIKNADELENYYKNSDYDFLIQEKINFKNEVGIFYHRFPDEKNRENYRNGKKRISLCKRKWKKDFKRTW